MTDEHLSLAPEIAHVRALLRAIGSDNPEERESAEAEAKGAVRLVGALVRCIALEQALRAEDTGAEATLAAILARAQEDVPGEEDSGDR